MWIKTHYQEVVCTFYKRNLPDTEKHQGPNNSALNIPLGLTVKISSVYVDCRDNHKTINYFESRRIGKKQPIHLRRKHSGLYDLTYQ